jgi:RimJ/RimL family protein N-acetyltransferase
LAEGKPTCIGETERAQIGIGISDRFHGSGLASLGMLFMKYVAALAGVGLGLAVNPSNARALRFYAKHGFVLAGSKELYAFHTRRRFRAPWYVLKRNELAAVTDGVNTQAGAP